MRRLVVEGGEKPVEPSYFPNDDLEVAEGEIEEVIDVLRTGRLSMFSSSKVEEFEQAFADFVGTDHCISVTNGTSALDVALRSVLEPGDEVLVPAYTYMATLMAVFAVDCKPVLVDIDPNSFTINPDEIERKITSRAEAIIPVHTFGNPADMEQIMEIAGEHDLRVIEDCAQATGAEFDGTPVGTFDVGCHSFMENKVLRTGEGGAITTDHPEVTHSAEVYRHEGEIWERTNASTTNASSLYFSDVTGGMDYVAKGHNFRMSPLIAALGLARLDTVEAVGTKMRNNAKFLVEEVRQFDEITPQESLNDGRAYTSFVARFDSDAVTRDEFVYLLGREGVPVGVHFPVGLHETTIWKRKFGDESHPHAEGFCRDHVAFPIYPAMENEHLETLVRVTGDVLAAIEDQPQILKEAISTELQDAEIADFYSGYYFNV